MSPASQVPLVNRSNLEAEIPCGSHGVCRGQRHTDFLYSRNGCAKKKRSSENTQLQR